MCNRTAIHGILSSPGLRAGAAALLASLVPGGSAHAQQNVGNTAPVVAAYCLATKPPTLCGNSPPGNLAQVAPDRFVVQGVTALQLVTQQFSLVSRRLQERVVVATGGGLATRPEAQQPIRLASASEAPLEVFAQSSVAAGGASSVARQPALGLYMRVESGGNRVKPTDFDRGFDLHATSLTLGGDYLLNPQTVLGLSYVNDVARSNLDTGDGGQPGSTNTRAQSIALYAAYRPSAYSYIDATLLAGRNKYATVRRFDFEISKIKDTASGAAQGRQQGLSLGAGYSFARERITLGPYARVDYARIDVDAFTEEGGADLNEIGRAHV